MKVVRSQFSESLAGLLTAASTRGSLAILRFCLAEYRAKEERVTLTATDLDNTLQVSLPANGSEDETFLFPLKTVADLLRTIDDPELEISPSISEGETSAHRVFVKSGGSSYQFHTVTDEDFPSLPDTEEGFEMVDLGGLQVFERVLGVAQSKASFKLDGALFEINGGTARAVATDGIRLVLAQQQILGEADVNTLLPSKGLRALCAIPGDKKFMVGRGDWKGKMVCFEAGRDAKLWTRTLEAAFPDYRRVLPKVAPEHVQFRIGAHELSRALQRLELLSGERFVAVNFAFDGKECVVKLVNPDKGAGVERLPAKAVHSVQGSIPVNGTFIREALDTLGGASEACLTWSPSWVRVTGTEENPRVKVLNIVSPIFTKAKESA